MRTFTIARDPDALDRAYRLTLPGQPPSAWRRRRDALSHALEIIHQCSRARAR